MTKKKQKKVAKVGVPTPVAEKKEKVAEELDMLEDIKRDEDLYISESDVTNISNFIRTTNKSFNSLGNTVVEKFNNRCSLAILHALIALFDLDSTDREDVIRRLNIIYIVWRLPELEQELRMKPTKTMSDVYCHPFATFLFYAEQLKQHVVESTLARIIVTNNVSVIEKLTAPDFISKAKSLDLHKVDLEAFAKWSEANTDHWPEITEEMVSLSKAMRELGCYSERKDHEAGMAEAFYPLVHNPPTMLPARMIPLPQEDPTILKWRMKKDPENQEAYSVIYSMSAGDDMQQKLADAFKEFGPTVDQYQAKIDSAMTPAELGEMRRVVTLDGEMSESSESEVELSDLDSDSEAEAEAKFRAMTEQFREFDEKVVEECFRRIFEGTQLTTSKLNIAIQFIRRMPLVHPLMLRVIDCAADLDNITKWCQVNAKFAAEFMIRHSQIDDAGETTMFRKYLDLAEGLTHLMPAFEFVIKLGIEYKNKNKLSPAHREAVLQFTLNAFKKVDDEGDDVDKRKVRLVSMLITKLLKEEIIHVDTVATTVKPFCLKFSDQRECTVLFQAIADIQSGKVTKVEETSTTSTTTTGSPSMMTTTTTTTSVNPNATSTTTTTTVVRQCGPAMIKQTSKKVVLQGSTAFHMKIEAAAFKSIGAAIAQTTQAFFRSSPSPPNTRAARPSKDPNTAVLELMEGGEEDLRDDLAELLSELENEEEEYPSDDDHEQPTLVIAPKAPQPDHEDQNDADDERDEAPIGV